MLAPHRLGHCSHVHELARASASAKLVAGDAPATPRPSHHHGWMRASTNCPQLLSAQQMMPCGQIPQRAAASGLAGG